MKSKVLSIVLMLIVVFAVSITAQNKKEAKVSEKARTAFNKAYPNASDVKWQVEGKSYEVEFKVNGLATSVDIDAEGKIAETESTISKTDLPKGVEEYVAKNHKGWSISEAAKIVDSKGTVTYEAQISKGKVNKDLIFTQEGKPVVKKEKKSDKEEKEDDEK